MNTQQREISRAGATFSPLRHHGFFRPGRPTDVGRARGTVPAAARCCGRTGGDVRVNESVTSACSGAVDLTRSVDIADTDPYVGRSSGSMSG